MSTLDDRVAELVPHSLRSLLLQGMELFDQQLGRASESDAERSTTCAGWTISDLVAHTADTADRAVAILRDETWAASDSDLSGPERWAKSSAALRNVLVTADLDDRWPLPDDAPHAKLRFHGCDFAVHRWDLAQSLGIDEELPSGWVEYMDGFFRSLPADALRRPRAFDAPLPPTESDGPTRRLMAFLGRVPKV